MIVNVEEIIKAYEKAAKDYHEALLKMKEEEHKELLNIAHELLDRLAGRPFSHLMLVLSEIAAQLAYGAARKHGPIAIEAVQRLLLVAINEGIEISFQKLEEEKVDTTIR